MKESKQLVLKAEGLTKWFGEGAQRVAAVHEVSMDLYKGEFVALTGPSGCGKSTLLNMLGLVESPTAGVLCLDGVNIATACAAQLRESRRSRVGYVFQSFNLLSTLTALENVMVPLILTGGDRAASEVRAKELLKELGLSHRLHSLPATLSGGESQRVAIARAVAHHPRYILADEPTGNLDSAAGASVLELLQRIASDGTAVLMATHSDGALRYCSRSLQMRDGELVDC